MRSFTTAVNAVLPFLLYLGFGYFIRQIGVTDGAFLKKLNKVVFLCFFPIMMFCNIYHIDTSVDISGIYVIIALVSLLILIAVLVLTVPRIVKGNPQRGVIIQAIFRSNFVLFALPMTEQVFGKAGTGVAAVLIAAVVPTYNIAAVLILELFSLQENRKVSGEGTSSALPALLVKNILTNPMIAGAITGAVFLFLRIHLPAVIDDSLSAISTMSTPLALFILGGTLQFRAIGHNRKYLVPGLAVKMVLLPMLATLLTLHAPVSNIERFVLLVMYGSPVAVSSYAMAENMGGDGELAGQFVVLSTALSIFTLFGWVLLYGYLGLL